MTRHYATLGGRRVHYRRWGTGPAILVIHGSPQSSRALERLGRIGADQGFCVIAPDTPGNGLSAPLDRDQPTVEDYAAALRDLVDHLGLARFGLYGFHTGAAIACAFGALNPDRVSAIAFDGLPCWTEEERADHLRDYLPRFLPQWDGSHMTWLWARLEEQMIFFPWNEPWPKRRMTYDVAPAAAQQANALDFLDSGDNYRAPYAAAFMFRAMDWRPRLTGPIMTATTRIDPLVAHLRRPPLSDLPHAIFDDAEGLRTAAFAFFRQHPGDPAPAPPAAGADASGLVRDFISLPGGAIAWCGQLAGQGRPLVLLHEAGGTTRQFDAVLAAIASQRPVIALDLPGHGESYEDWPRVGPGVCGIMPPVAEALRHLGVDKPAVVGAGLGALLSGGLREGGVAASAHRLGPPQRLAESGLSVHDLAPDLSPEWDGAHLLRAFRIARYERLFAPWCRRDQGHALPVGDLDPAAIQLRAIGLLKAQGRWTDAVRAEIEGAAPRDADCPILPECTGAKAEDAPVLAALDR